MCLHAVFLGSQARAHACHMHIEMYHAARMRTAGIKLKTKKSAGPDNLTAEHLHYAGQPIIIWLTGLLNLIIELELIPPSLKQGITIPVFKGGGKDPLNVNSYRGITLNSVISKIMELLILNRVNPVLMEAGFPHSLPIDQKSLVLMPFLPPKKWLIDTSRREVKCTCVYMTCKKHLIRWSFLFF